MHDKQNRWSTYFLHVILSSKFGTLSAALPSTLHQDQAKTERGANLISSTGPRHLPQPADQLLHFPGPRLPKTSLRVRNQLSNRSFHPKFNPTLNPSCSMPRDVGIIAGFEIANRLATRITSDKCDVGLRSTNHLWAATCLH
jgi:hypothetical protein